MFWLPSYLRAVAMARHKDFLVEKKRVNKFNLSVKCGSIKDVSAAFAQMMELTIPGKTVMRHVCEFGIERGMFLIQKWMKIVSTLSSTFG